MAAPNSDASKKAAKAGVKNIPIAKSGIKDAARTKPAAAVKKASPLKKVGSKVIKKTTGKKASAGGVVAAFDLEAFVKVKFSEVEKTAHQKKVSLNVAATNHLCPAECVWEYQQHRGRLEQVQHEGG